MLIFSDWLTISNKIISLKVKERRPIILSEIHLRTTGRHLSVGSHSDRPAFTPTGQVGTRFIHPVRIKGWVGLVGWLHTDTVYPSGRPQTVTHPGTNWVWRSATTLIEANALPLSQTANQLALLTCYRQALRVATYRHTASERRLSRYVRVGDNQYELALECVMFGVRTIK